MANTRLGCVLTSAAMMDDVVGLVIVNIVGGDSSIARTIGASLGLILAVPVLAWILSKVVKKQMKLSRQITWVIHTAILLALITAAAYAGASILLAAFLAGAAIAWWDTHAVHKGDPSLDSSAIKIYGDYYHVVVERLLKPFFFVCGSLLIHQHKFRIRANTFRLRSDSLYQSLGCLERPWYGRG